MAEHPNSPRESTDAPVADQNPGWESAVERDLLILILLAIAVGLNILVTHAGYTNGYHKPIDIGSPFSALEFILIPVMLYLLGRIRTEWGRQPVGDKVVLFVFLLIPQLPLQYFGAYACGSGQVLSFLGREKADLRFIATAIEEYHLDHTAYPPTLDKLVPELMSAIPHSAYVRESLAHYALLDEQTSGTRTFWLLWFPGPDRQYDIQEGPELQAALKLLAGRQPSPWLTERTYDPSNGSASGGDICRYDGQ